MLNYGLEILLTLNKSKVQLKKVLVFPGKIAHYRVDFYKALSEQTDLDLCLAYYGALPSNAAVLKCKLLPLKLINIGPLQFTFNLFKQRNNFDLFIVGFNLLRPINLLLFLFSKVPFIWWGIGIGNKSFINSIRVKLISRSDGLITYMPKAKQWYIEKGISEDMIAIAGNTVHVSDPQMFPDNKKKRKILLLGTLNNRKKFEDVFHAFNRILNKIPKNIELCIVGDGDKFIELNNLAQDLKIHDRTTFKGKITDEKGLKEIFKEIIFSVSPGQAGLSILHCFAFGIPFVTYKDAISGGELDNIIHGKNGMLVNPNVDSLSNTMLNLILDKEYLERLSVNSYEYYVSERSMDKMVLNFMDLIRRVS